MRNPLFHGCPLGRPFLILEPQDSRRDERMCGQPDRVSWSGGYYYTDPIWVLPTMFATEGELLVWGSLIHVGKNAVKGDGWYTISA